MGGEAAEVEVISTESAESIEDYWTPERMAAARPAIDVGAPGVTGQEVPPPLPATEFVDEVRVEGTEPTVAQPEGVAPLAIGLTPRVGKLYFRDGDGLDWYCTAAVINSATDNTLTTSGYCVHGIGGADWHTGLHFAPAASGSSQPYGTFSYSGIRSTTGWTQSKDQNYNYAFVKVKPRASDGRSLESVTGSFGYTYGGSQTRQVTYWGYVVDGAYWCRYTSSVYVTNGQQSIPCVRTSGGGGPWLDRYSDSTNSGYIFCSNARYIQDSQGSRSLCSYQGSSWYNLFIGYS